MILSKVKEILVDELGVNEDEVTLEAHVINDLGADSLAVMQVVMAIEGEFDIEVPEEDIVNLKTVSDIVTYVESKK